MAQGSGNLHLNKERFPSAQCDCIATMQSTIAEQAGASDPSSQSTGRSAISESSVNSEGDTDNVEYPGTPVAALGVDGVDAFRDNFMANSEGVTDNVEYPGTPVAALGVDGFDAFRDNFTANSEGVTDNVEYPGTPVAALGVDGFDAFRDNFMACKSPISPREAVVELRSDRSTLVSLKNILLNQQLWRTTSEGYQNFFEFGELHVLFRVVVQQWYVIYRDAPEIACQLPS
jgi:hypothetical protein